MNLSILVEGPVLQTSISDWLYRYKMVVTCLIIPYMICICIIFHEISCVNPKPLLTEHRKQIQCFVCSSFTDRSLTVHLALARRSSNATYSICNTCNLLHVYTLYQLESSNCISWTYKTDSKQRILKFSKTIVLFTGIRKKLPLGDKRVLSKHTCNSLL